MKTVFIIHTHWLNRGDEAANRALFDELQDRLKDVKIILQILNTDLTQTEKLEKQGIEILDNHFPRTRDIVEFILIYISKGKLAFSKSGKSFVNAVKMSDYIVHAPGGPAIGDIYSSAEHSYLLRLLFARRVKKRYMFFAPSMGPFNNKLRNIFRKKVLLHASRITFREDISAEYFHSFLPEISYEVTLDSAFQNEINSKENEIILNKENNLIKFLNTYKKVIGITITDLRWNPYYKNNKSLSEKIRTTFVKFIKFLENQNYGVIFIPQLFGKDSDYNYMNSFSGDNTYTLEDRFDCYFQQYLISKLYAVVGMRYHSNIFSCKMSVPFLSISYEQKMLGFMKKTRLHEYCIPVEDLDFEMLVNKFILLENNYNTYKNKLVQMSNELRNLSRRTMDILLEELTEK